MFLLFQRFPIPPAYSAIFHVYTVLQIKANGTPSPHTFQSIRQARPFSAFLQRNSCLQHGIPTWKTRWLPWYISHPPLHAKRSEAQNWAARWAWHRWKKSAKAAPWLQTPRRTMKNSQPVDGPESITLCLLNTGRKWGDAVNYDLCINSACYGIEESVELIERMIDIHPEK